MIALAATGSATSCAIAAGDRRRPTATMIVTNRTMSVKSNDCQALKPSCRRPAPGEVLTLVATPSTEFSAEAEPRQEHDDEQSRRRRSRRSSLPFQACPASISLLVGNGSGIVGAQPIQLARTLGRRAAAYLRAASRSSSGPTPPGTGRDRAGHLGHRLEVDVADQAVVGAVRADVDHRRARLHHLGGHQARRADGRDQDVGARADRGEVARCASGRRSRSRSRPSSSAASGRPTRIERPSDHRLGALDLGARLAAAARSRRCGVHGTSPGRPWASSPALAAVSPSTSLAGSIALITASWSSCSGSGSCTRMPSTVVLLVELRDQVEQLVGRGRLAELVVKRAHPDLLGLAALVGDVDLRGRVLADQHRRQPGHVSARARRRTRARRRRPAP